MAMECSRDCSAVCLVRNFLYYLIIMLHICSCHCPSHILCRPLRHFDDLTYRPPLLSILSRPNPLCNVCEPCSFCPLARSTKRQCPHVQANPASWWYFQTIGVALDVPIPESAVSNQVSSLLLHSLGGSSVSPSNTHQLSISSHFECDYSLPILAV